MPGLEDLYREIILDHYRNPRNRGELETPPAHRTEGFNPLCGDEIVVYVSVDDAHKVAEIKIGGQGCSISQSSASMMSAAVKGKTLDEALQIRNTEIVQELALPPVKIHRSVLAEDAIKAAIHDYQAKQGVKSAIVQETAAAV